MEVEKALRNICHAQRFAFDIGYRVIKVVYLSKINLPAAVFSKEEEKKDGTRLHCVHFGFEDLERVCLLIKKSVDCKGKKVPFSRTHPDTEEFQELIEKLLEVELVKVKDIDCLIRGTNFLLSNILDEVFTYDHHNESCKYSFQTLMSTPDSRIYPYVIVNVATGMTMTKVNSADDVEILSGSHLGGGAFFGLACLLTNVTDVSQLVKMAEEGDHRRIDALVGDIYGDTYDNATLNLDPDLIAGSFGKCSKRSYAEKVEKDDSYKKDMVRSLLLMVSNEIGRIISQNIDDPSCRIIFTGFLVRNYPIIMRTISYAVSYWCKKGNVAQTANFLRHEGYMSGIGALIYDMEKNEEGSNLTSASWKEHYTGSSDLGRFVPKSQLDLDAKVETLELDCTEMLLEPFPLLSSKVNYVPDTVDLNTDFSAKDFWIPILESSIGNMVKKAVDSQKESGTAQARANEVSEKYLKQLKLIQEKPFSYGSCNIRHLLDLREQIFQEEGFDDPFRSQKRIENEVARNELGRVLKRLDDIRETRQRLAEATKGLLAGNVFDWGAKEVVKLLEGKEEFTFEKAKAVLPARPWLVDHMDDFLDDVLSQKITSTVIFVDNSGADFFLGVLPFARELIKLGVKVSVATNLLPALNDITYGELLTEMERVMHIDDQIKQAYERRVLKFCHSGQGSPCLDLRKVNSDLSKLVREDKVDLVVIEGMGRALHTNYEALFTVNCLKAAVIKTQWLADRLGGELFSVVCKYERPSE